MTQETRYWLDDVVYMRWLKGKEVHRVARVNDGAVVAFYPRPDKQSFGFEAFTEIDDPGAKAECIPREKIKDEVFLRLLDGDDIINILRDYVPASLGEDNEGDNHYSYYYAKRGRSFSQFRTPHFHIVDDNQERCVREEVCSAKA